MDWRPGSLLAVWRGVDLVLDVPMPVPEVGHRTTGALWRDSEQRAWSGVGRSPVVTGNVTPTSFHLAVTWTSNRRSSVSIDGDLVPLFYRILLGVAPVLGVLIGLLVLPRLPTPFPGPLFAVLVVAGAAVNLVGTTVRLTQATHQARQYLTTTLTP